MTELSFLRRVYCKVRKSYQSVACRCVCYSSPCLQVQEQDHSHGWWSNHLANNVPLSLESLRHKNENTEAVRKIRVKAVEITGLKFHCV